MLVLTGERERTGAELNRLFGRGGLGHGTVINTDGPVRIVEAKALSSPGPDQAARRLR